MTLYSKSAVLSATIAIFAIPSVAMADAAPKIQVGNGAAITGSNNSLLGVSVLAPEANRTPISVRLLGSDKLLGVSLRSPDSKAKTLYLQIEPSLDTRANLNLPK